MDTNTNDGGCMNPARMALEKLLDGLDDLENAKIIVISTGKKDDAEDINDSPEGEMGIARDKKPKDESSKLGMIRQLLGK